MDDPQRMLEISQLSKALSLDLIWKHDDNQSLHYRDKLYSDLQTLLRMKSFQTLDAICLLAEIKRTQEHYISHLYKFPVKTIYKRKRHSLSDSSEAAFTSESSHSDVLGQVLTLVERDTPF